MTAVKPHPLEPDFSSPPHSNILVVDDEPANFDVIESLLESYDYNLHYLSSGLDAIKYFETLQPDLILLDVMMPQLNGMEACQKIRALPKGKHVPIMMVTALHEAHYLAQSLASGANDFIRKPIQAIELRARVQSLLRVKHQYDQLKDLVQAQEQTIHILEQNITALCGNLASSLPHELNTPLNGILGCLELLKCQTYQTLSTESQGILDMCQRSALRLNQLTQRCINYLRLELDSVQAVSNSASTKLPQTTASISTLWIRQYIESQAREFNRYEEFQCVIEPAAIPLSSMHLEWLVAELTDNAFKFSPAGTVVQITGKIDFNDYVLEFYNQGRGMTPTQIEQIEAFRQFDRDIYEQQGLGLGLKIVKRILEYYGGKFEITGKYQQNLIVRVIIPLN